MEKFLDVLEDEGLQVSTLPGHAPPVPDAMVAPVELSKEVIRVVILPDQERQGKLSVEWLLQFMSAAFPWYDFHPCQIRGALSDEMGRTRWFDTKSGAPADRAKRSKLVRRDLLTGAAYALRGLLGCGGRAVRTPQLP